MRQYLQVHVGPYQLLLDAQGIHEILELSGQGEVSGYRDWRGKLLVPMNSRRLLGLKKDIFPAVYAGVVYSFSDDSEPVMFEFDRVERLRQVEENDLSTLPFIPKFAAQLFDLVYSDATLGVQLYHLRRPLELDSLQLILDTQLE
jgi:chemotaxis signal transduction protein